MSGAQEVEPTGERAEGEPAGAPLPLGEALIREGLVTRRELDEVVAHQREEARRGVFLRLGELLVARGLVDEATVARVLAAQGRVILFCATCSVQFNVVDFDPRRTYRCVHCDGQLAQPETLSRLSVEDTLGPGDARASGLGRLGPGEERRFGPFVILGEISRGGMGIVYKARQVGLERIVAVKVMADAPGDLKGAASAREAFLREARAVARLRHPYVVAIHEVGRVDGVDYFSMDYIEGLPLQLAATREGLDQRELAEVVLKVCEAVAYAHGQGVLHRDIKPANILLDRRHEPVLIDFGIAHAAGPGGPAEGKDEIVGSPAFLPPEYVTGERSYGQAGEVYALGATLYTLLAGRPPHTGIDTVQVLRRAQVEPVTPIRNIRRGIHRDLAQIVMTAVARDPDARYASAQDLASDLRRWLDGEEVAGRKGSVWRAWLRVRGRVAAAVGLFLAFFLLLVTTTQVTALQAQRELDQRRLEQLEGDIESLYGRLVVARMDVARARLDGGDAAEAAALLTDLLQQPYATGEAARIRLLRARAREALGDATGAAVDRAAAAR